MKKIFAVILHYGDKKLTLRCIDSIINTKNKFEEIVVVDNTNQFKVQSSKFKVGNVKIIRNRENLGYAGGMNVGIQYSLSKDADYVLLLNNDTVFEEEIISSLVQYLERHGVVGIVAPAVKFIRNEKTIYDLGGKINKIFGKTTHREVEKIIDKNVRMVDYVSGCSMMIKKEVFENIGLLDEKFFLYYEDVDFCLRAKKAGFNTCVVPGVNIYHELSGSVGKISNLGIYNQTKSALIFGRKHLGLLTVFNIFFVFFQSIHFLLKNPKYGKSAVKGFIEAF